ncbi:MAG: hypothetical protein KDK60_00255 [Chlamydiia bacterium]|nr:hypothetical protein [Chlamydiia bacterium]
MSLPSLDQIASPYEFWRMTDAIYKQRGIFGDKKKVNAYIQKHSYNRISLKKIDTLSAFPWVFCLFLVESVKEKYLVASFQGSHDFSQWLENIFGPPKDTAALTQKMSETIRKWEKKYQDAFEKSHQRREWGKVVAFTGHSRGGQFATLCCIEKNIWRLTWNGYGVKTGALRINLATDEDPMTCNGILCNPTRYTRVGPGTHSLHDFKPYCKNVKWKAFQSPSPFLLLKKHFKCPEELKELHPIVWKNHIDNPATKAIYWKKPHRFVLINKSGKWRFYALYPPYQTLLETKSSFVKALTQFQKQFPELTKFPSKL